MTVMMYSPLSLRGVRGDGNSFTYCRLNRCVTSIYEGKLRMTTELELAKCYEGYLSDNFYGTIWGEIH